MNAFTYGYMCRLARSPPHRTQYSFLMKLTTLCIIASIAASSTGELNLRRQILESQLFI